MKQEQILSELKKELLKKLHENKEILDSQPETEYNIEDTIGSFWIVKKAVKESTEDDMIQETDIFGLAEMISSFISLSLCLRPFLEVFLALDSDL